MRWSSRGSVIVLLGSVLVVPAEVAEAGATCAGHAVTISFQDLPRGVTTINGTSGPDVIQGGPASEVINAGGGEDYVCAGAGYDLINGGPGRDELFGQDDSDEFSGADLGQDLITGGSKDADTVSYKELTAGVRVDLSTGLVTPVAGGPSGGIVGVEVVAGTKYDDVLIGQSGKEVIYGGGGKDTLDGRGGDDNLFGGKGADRIVYAKATTKVRVDLTDEVALVGNDRDDFRDIEDVVGTRFDDRIVGDRHNNHLIGGGGDDLIKGKNGDDVLEGGAGDDLFFPSGGDDFVDGGDNDAVTSTGEHGDMVSYQGDTVDEGESGFSAELRTHPFTGNPPFAQGVGDDTLSGIESVRGVKDKTNILIGNDEANVLIGGDKTDLVHGRGGNDLIFGLGRGDSLFGDNGPDDPATPFGDDYIDGGKPTAAEGDEDHAHGQGGDDTCTNVDFGQSTGCETTF
ncbi:calcium-binding protein [Nocardioides humilatus]|uniref:Calcium-binding protein n=1 Tax=Nocardioides humilatus TaxID=2607660 RepID=A0A5B1LL17_9ACTN|nr:calcium-binding protein [Nocardioides humilatus]KAA1421402.1 calcium-binding protein [Nocardioides humilatus]